MMDEGNAGNLDTTGRFSINANDIGYVGWSKSNDNRDPGGNML